MAIQNSRWTPAWGERAGPVGRGDASRCRDRLHVLLAGKVTLELGRRLVGLLVGLLVLAPAERSSDLDRFRQAPKRASGPQIRVPVVRTEKQGLEA